MLTDGARAHLNALVEDLERDAFQRGWDAAIKHILSAATSAPKGVAQSTAGTDAPAATTRKTGYGVVPALVREMLDEAGDLGIVPAEVVARGRERGEKIAEASVRQRLRKMKIAKEARNERGRWFRASVPHDSTRQENGDAETSPSDELGFDNGGFHAAA